jgi:glycosyltransferase involved in cell wall biosynthesis
MSTPQRILIFIDWFLPGYKAGGPISSNANLTDHLSKEFQFYIITRDTDYCETKPYTTIKSEAWNTMPNGSQIYYCSSKQLGFRKLISVCKTVEFDKVYINGIYSLYFSLFPLIWFKYFKAKPVVVASRGMLSDHSFSSKKSKKKLFYSFAKFIGLYNKIVFHATNGEEELQIRKNVGFKGIVKIAPNLPPLKNSSFIKRDKKVGELRIISIARVSEEKNTLFALQVLKNCKAEKIVFDLYGTIYNETYWAECKRVIAELPASIRVEFKGAVDKTRIPELLSQYHFLLMPSQGENYGHSIVEAFMAGCPVIISDRTPWLNLQSVNSELQSVNSDQLTVNSNEQATITNRQSSISNQQSSVGWDLSLNNMPSWVSVIEYCAAMEQEEFNIMSMNAFKFSQKVVNNSEVLEANRRLFENE